MNFTIVAPTAPHRHRSELTAMGREGKGVDRTAEEQGLLSAATTGSVPRR